MTVALVVDDEFAVLEALSRALEAEGYVVSTASDGVLALSVLEQETVSFVLCDRTMPFMGGLRLRAAMLSRDSMRDIPFVLMAQVFENVDPALGLTVLRKPVRLPALRAVLANLPAP